MSNSALNGNLHRIASRVFPAQAAPRWTTSPLAAFSRARSSTVVATILLKTEPRAPILTSKSSLIRGKASHESLFSFLCETRSIEVRLPVARVSPRNGNAQGPQPPADDPFKDLAFVVPLSCGGTTRLDVTREDDTSSTLYELTTEVRSQLPFSGVTPATLYSPKTRNRDRTGLTAALFPPATAVGPSVVKRPRTRIRNSVLTSNVTSRRVGFEWRQ